LAKKKGLGAQKVNADFKEIERAMHEQEKMREYEIEQQAKSKEENEKNVQKQMASMKLAYDNLDKTREKEETKLKNDPKKAEQLERLGMGVGRSGGVSHNAMTDMQIIQQEGVYSTKPSMPKQRDFFDDFDNNFSTSKSNNNGSSNNNNRFTDETSDFKGFSKSTSSSKFDDWVNVDDKFDDSQPPPIQTLENSYQKFEFFFVIDLN
jgi:ADP-ribosylation factor GTPase-activating protein 2/3